VEGAGVPFDTVHREELATEVIDGAAGIILCGTAVGDNEVLDDTGPFGWIKEFDRPLLGICVGANLICRVHGGELEKLEEIGHVRLTACEGPSDKVIGDLDGDEVYNTRLVGPVLPPGFIPLARSDAGVQAFSVEGRPTYGILFHPEVRHRDIIGRFCALYEGK
jgi:GMP synthase-like glutamine amidotransferase